jgi:ABC-type hemin transport system substrate-binding protein
MPDGTVNEILENGNQRQTHPDGTVITKLRNGTTVQVKGDTTITFMPIGIVNRLVSRNSSTNAPSKDYRRK